jgi:hypothetical protein
VFIGSTTIPMTGTTGSIGSISTTVSTQGVASRSRDRAVRAVSGPGFVALRIQPKFRRDGLFADHSGSNRPAVVAHGHPCWSVSRGARRARPRGRHQRRNAAPQTPPCGFLNRIDVGLTTGISNRARQTWATSAARV